MRSCLQVIFVPLTADFEPDDGTVKLALKNWNNSDLKTIPQDKIMGCASGTRGSDSEVAGPCVQDRPPGTAGTCYDRTPLKPNGTPDTSKAGWFQASKGAVCIARQASTFLQI
ncbi:MAG: hypothetical protein JST16_05870 [Bdellovibrionales bacterium]|nr:hypothetical protein [Bdellovibrionales bacterium]